MVYPASHRLKRFAFLVAVSCFGATRGDLAMPDGDLFVAWNERPARVPEDIGLISRANSAPTGSRSARAAGAVTSRSSFGASVAASPHPVQEELIASSALVVPWTRKRTRDPGQVPDVETTGPRPPAATSEP